MVKNVKRYMKQQKKDVLVESTPEFIPVTYILPQVSCQSQCVYCKSWRY
jgi:hypothetical protein